MMISYPQTCLQESGFTARTVRLNFLATVSIIGAQSGDSQATQDSKLYLRFPPLQQ